MCFSPDSTRLAVAQSDCIVYVYRLGLEWGEKKKICNKFLHSTAVTCVAWPNSPESELVYGCADGMVDSDMNILFFFFFCLSLLFSHAFVLDVPVLPFSDRIAQ